MLDVFENLIFRYAAPMAIRHLEAPDLKRLDSNSKKVLGQARREFQIAPPLIIHTADPILIAGYWSAVREVYVVNVAGRTMREAVAATISQLNECPYCETVHKALFASSNNGPHNLNGQAKLPEDVAAAQAWAASTLSPDANVICNPQIVHSVVPEVYGTAFLFHYTNRMVNVFLTDSPIAIAGAASATGKRITETLFSMLGHRMVSVDPKPGQAVGAIEPAGPSAFSFAHSDNYVDAGLSQFTSAVEQAGHEAVPDEVRKLVLNHLESWRGAEAPLSRAWVEDLVAKVGKSNKAAARLALLTARASYQVDAKTVDEFRAQTPEDKALLQTVSWASFVASKQIFSWLPAPTDQRT